jgi:hypothetical protein
MGTNFASEVIEGLGECDVEVRQQAAVDVQRRLDRRMADRCRITFGWAPTLIARVADRRELKPFREFPTDKATKDGLSSWSRSCHADADRRWRGSAASSTTSSTRTERAC